MLPAKLDAAVCKSTPDEATIVCEVRLAAGVDLVLGGDPMASLIVPDWVGPSVLLISGDGLLHLGPAMREHTNPDHEATDERPCPDRRVRLREVRERPRRTASKRAGLIRVERPKGRTV